MAKIQKYKLKNGLFKYEVFCYIGTDSTGKQKRIHKRGFNSEKEAKIFANKTESAIINNQITTSYNGKVTIAEYLKDWLKKYKTNVGEGSMIVYRYQVNKYLIPNIGNIRLTDYTFKRHQDFINYMLKNGGKNGSPLSRNTVQIINATLSNAYSKAVKLGLVNNNPTLKVEFPREEIKSLHNYWFLDDENKFLKFASFEAEPVWYTFFLTLIELGIRKGEGMALCWDDIDFDNNTIHIRRNRLYRRETKENIGSIVVDSTKSSGSTHKLFMTKKLRNALLNFRRLTFNSDKIINLKSDKDEISLQDFIFRYTFSLKKKGKIIRSRSVDGAFKRIIKRAEVPNITIHGLRHSHAIIMREAGIPLEDIQAQLGHLSSKSTQIYAKPTDKTVKRASSQYEQFVNNYDNKKSN